MGTGRECRRAELHLHARVWPAATCPIVGVTAPIQGAPQMTSPRIRLARPGTKLFDVQAPVLGLIVMNEPFPVFAPIHTQRLANEVRACTTSQYLPGAGSRSVLPAPGPV